MRLSVVAIGRFRAGPERSLFQGYLRRLPWTLQLREIGEARARTAVERCKREGKLLLDALPKGATVVALDQGGENLDSRAFAGALARWQDDGVRHLAFVIGGPDGLDEAMLRRADLVLSLGRMTWPHQLVRPLLTEQLYRAHAILSEHPYHRA